LEVRRLFDLVRDDVLAATKRRQQPFSYGSLPGSEDDKKPARRSGFGTEETSQVCPLMSVD
jgi:hypothetical protein